MSAAPESQGRRFDSCQGPVKTDWLGLIIHVILKQIRHNFDFFVCVGVMYSVCDVTLSVYPHRAIKLEKYATMARHIFQACPVYTLRVTSQTSYSPEYITVTHKKDHDY